MYKVGDYVVYGRSVCQIKEISKHAFGSAVMKTFYVLIPTNDAQTRINIPVEQENSTMRNIISAKEAEALINDIPNIEEVDITNDRMADNDYKELICSGKHRDLIRVIKTTYLRNKSRTDAGKKVSEKDINYFNTAETMLYGELAVSLGMSYKDTKQYILDKVEAMK